MEKALCVLVILAFIVVGCVCEGPAKSRRSGEKYYPVKVCSIGDTDGSTCVEYAKKPRITKKRMCPALMNFSKLSPAIVH